MRRCFEMSARHAQETEVEISAIRAQVAGGQNVNKVSSESHLRFDIAASSLPEEVKERLLALSDSRITKEGVSNCRAFCAGVSGAAAPGLGSALA